MMESTNVVGISTSNSPTKARKRTSVAPLCRKCILHPFKMSIDPRLAPVAQNRAPYPSFEPNVAFPLAASVSCSSENHDLERQTPQPDHEHLATRPAASSSHRLPTEHFIPPLLQPKPPKSFEFVEIRDPSGKRNSASSAQVRSYIMRMYHQKRRTLQKTRFTTAECDEDGSTHLRECFYLGNHTCTINIPCDIPSTLKRGPPGSQINQISMPDLSKSYFMRYLTCPNLIVSQGFLNVFTSDVACTQCGKLMLLISPSDGKIQLTSSLGSPQTLLDANPTDPFNSSAIPISHRMHELVYHCKISSSQLGIP